MAAASPVSSVEALLAAIEKSGLVAAAELAKVRELAQQATDPKQLARRLIQEGTLTKWQAGQLLHSYHRLILGKYELLDQVSASDLGRVYLVEHVQMKRRHLLRVLAKRHTSNTETVQRFLAEARQTCSLDHRNIRHIFDVTFDGEYCYVVMEHIEGTDLQRLITEEGPLKWRDALAFVCQAAAGLEHAHTSGIAHGNLTPADLLLDDNGTIKILEIGQAGLTKMTSEERSEVPKQSDMRAADIQSLGRVLSFLLTGEALADAEAARARLQQLADLPPEIASLCCELLDASSTQHPKDMTAAIEQIVRAERGVSARQAAAAEASAAAESQSKAKKLPAAKPLADATDGGVASASQSRAKKDGTHAKQGSALGKRQAGAEAANRLPSRAWIVGVACAGVGALVGIAALTAFLFGGGDDNVVQSPKAKAGAVKTAAVNQGKAKAEANPQVAVEANPLVATRAETESPSATTSTPTPVAEPKVEKKASNETVKTDMKESNPAPTPEKKPEAKVAAKPPAAKPKDGKSPPKAAPPPGPFQGFAKAIALAGVPETAPETAAASPTPQELGPCKVDEKILLMVALKGGETVFRGGRQKFVLQPRNETDLREWEIVLAGGDKTQAIANLSAADGKLTFQWTPEGLRLPEARLLCNCALELKAGTNTHVVALRQRIVAPPLNVDVERRGASAKWDIGDLSDPKHVLVQVIGADGLTAHGLDPDAPVMAGDDVTIWTGPDQKSPTLALKLATSATARGVNVSLTPQVKLEGMQRPQPYLKRELAAELGRRSGELTMLMTQMKQANEAKPKDSKERAQITQIKGQLTTETTWRETYVRQLQELGEFVAAIQGTGKIHFRVFYRADDAEVELLVTTEAPPAKGPAKAADAKSAAK